MHCKPISLVMCTHGDGTECRSTVGYQAQLYQTLHSRGAGYARLESCMLSQASAWASLVLRARPHSAEWGLARETRASPTVGLFHYHDPPAYIGELYCVMNIFTDSTDPYEWVQQQMEVGASPREVLLSLVGEDCPLVRLPLPNFLHSTLALRLSFSPQTWKRWFCGD